MNWIKWVFLGLGGVVLVGLCWVVYKFYKALTAPKEKSIVAEIVELFNHAAPMIDKLSPKLDEMIDKLSPKLDEMFEKVGPALEQAIDHAGEQFSDAVQKANQQATKLEVAPPTV